MGDIMPGGVLVDGHKFIANKLSNRLKIADIRVATLESAIGENLQFDVEKMANDRCVIYSPNKSIQVLKDMKIDVVSLANNHSFDLGEKGLLNTIELLEANNIKFVGAGRNESEARKPLVVEKNGRKIAFIAYIPESWMPNHAAEGDKPGLNTFEITRIKLDVINLKKACDYVFILPHIGVEFTYWPCPGDVNNIKELIEAGCDGVFCSHSHQIQPSLQHKGKPIVFSMGNFLFPDYYATGNNPIIYPTSIKDTTCPSFPDYNHPSRGIWKRVWSHKNRISQIYFYNNATDNSKQYTILSIDNNLDVFSPRVFLQIKLSIIGKLALLKNYRFIYLFLTKLKLI